MSISAGRVNLWPHSPEPFESPQRLFVMLFIHKALLIAFVLVPGSALPAEDLTGTWQGVVHNPDSNQDLRTVVKITSSDGDMIKANFYSIDQTYLVFPATGTLRGSVIKINIPGIGAVYDAKLSADGNTMTGAVKGFSMPAPWILKRVSEGQAWAIPKPPPPVKPLASADPAFEVAAIRLSQRDDSGRIRRGGRVQNGNVSMLGVTLSQLMTFVYQIHEHQIAGAPAWVTSEQYDIVGKPDGEGEPTQDQLKIMLRKLMGDRFQLAFHKEERELSTYSLRVAKGGLKISTNDSKNEATGIFFRGPGSVLFNNVTMDDFCRMLQSSAVDRPVVNETGLTAKYDFSLIWTPEQMIATAAGNANALSPGDKEPPPDIYAAIQQQLGLKIDAMKLRTDVLVIDKVEKPSEN